MPVNTDSDAVDADAEYTQDDILNEEENSFREAATDPPAFDPGFAAQTSLFSSSVNQSDAAATVYPYTGATPIPLDPIDAPTPTPQAPLNFTYITYSPTTVGVSFEAPAGWVADDTYNEVFPRCSNRKARSRTDSLASLTSMPCRLQATIPESELVQENQTAPQHHRIAGTSLNGTPA